MRRVKLTLRQFQDLVEARDWCLRNDFTGFVRFYDDLLAYHDRRGALPREAYGPEDEEAEGITHVS